MRSHSEGVTIATSRKPALRKLVKLAIDQGHLWPAFQPIVEIRTGSVAGFEILARWGSPKTGQISPATFIPRLEQHGMIDMLSDALIGRACCAAAAWPGQFSLAFNISPVQLINGDFPRRLAEVVATTGFPLSRVELEVTEVSLISDENQAYKVLKEVNDLGVRIGIDDFGTGYSSLARLESFPFRKLKIDARFARDLDGESGKRRIAAAIIGLGHSLGMTVVAEGIETAAEDAILRDLGCDLGQGWLYGKGERAIKAQRVLKRRGSVHSASPPLDASPFQQLHQLASLYDQAPIGLCFVDTDYRHVRVNDHFASIHGLARAELEGKTVNDIIEPEMLPDVMRALTEAADADGHVKLRYVSRGRDFHMVVSRVQDLAGEMIGFSVVTIEVTGENQLKATLVASEQRLRQELEYAEAVINSLPGIFFYYDADERLRRWNKNYQRLTGFTVEQLQGKGPLQCFANEEKKKVANMVRQIFEQGKAQFEANFLTGDGQRIPYLFTGIRFEPNGRAGFVGVGMDISDLRRVQQALRERETLFEAMLHTCREGMLLLDPHGKRLIQNSRLSELWKVPQDVVSDPDGRVQLDFIASRVMNSAEFAAKIAWLDAYPDAVCAETIEHVDGRLFICHSTPIRDAEGNHYGRLWAFSEEI